MPTLKSLRQGIQKDSQLQPASQEQTKQPKPVLDKILFPSIESTKELKQFGIKQVLTTILGCAKDATQTIYSLDIDSFEDDMLVIRADIFLELLQQEIEKLDE